MGCGTSSVVPLPDSDIEEACGIKVRVNPSTPEQTQSAKLKNGKTTNHAVTNGKQVKLKNITNSKKPPPFAFEVPIFDDENGSIIKKHPPKRFRRFEEAVPEANELNHETLDERQKEAEKRRNEILSQRVMSAKARPRLKPLNHSDAFSQDSSESWERNM